MGFGQVFSALGTVQQYFPRVGAPVDALHITDYEQVRHIKGGSHVDIYTTFDALERLVEFGKFGSSKILEVTPSNIGVFVAKQIQGIDINTIASTGSLSVDNLNLSMYGIPTEPKRSSVIGLSNLIIAMGDIARYFSMLDIDALSLQVDYIDTQNGCCFPYNLQVFAEVSPDDLSKVAKGMDLKPRKFREISELTDSYRLQFDEEIKDISVVGVVIESKTFRLTMGHLGQLGPAR